MATPLTITKRHLSGAVILLLAGPLRRTDVTLREAIAKLTPSEDQVVFDLAGVTGIDTRSAIELVEDHKMFLAQRKRLRLAAVPEPIMRRLRELHFHTVLEIHDTVADAVASFDH